MIYTCIADNDLNYHVGFTRGANMHKTIMACGYYMYNEVDLYPKEKKKHDSIIFFQENLINASWR